MKSQHKTAILLQVGVFLETSWIWFFIWFLYMGFLFLFFLNQGKDTQEMYPICPFVIPLCWKSRLSDKLEPSLKRSGQDTFTEILECRQGKNQGTDVGIFQAI